MSNSLLFTKTEFSYLRELTILEILQERHISLQEILSMEKSNIRITTDKIYIKHTQQEYDLSKSAKDYFFLHKKITPNSHLLFPTYSGKKLRRGKFIEHVNSLFKKANITSIYHPEQQIQEELRQLISQRFAYQRTRYQHVITGALMGTVATRPGEIAQLEKRDVYLSAETIKLQKTKGQEIQWVPIYPVLIPILKTYLEHLPTPKTPLFIRSTGRKWSRKDVSSSMKKFGKYCGIDGVTAQRMRPTVVLELYRNGATLAEIQGLTRHKQMGTLQDHYLAPQKDDARKALTYLNPFPIKEETQLKESRHAKF
jgi:site-specific recombinase XerD